MTIVSPYENSADWDSITICVRRAGKTNLYVFEDVPVDIDGDLENDFDNKKPKGADGARVTDNGYKASEFPVIWTLHRPDHFRTYLEMFEDARPRPGKEPKPTIGIVHPIIQLCKFESLKIQKLRFPSSKVVDQWEAKLEVIEDLPAPKPVKKDTKEGSITLPEITIVGARQMLGFRRTKSSQNPPRPLPSSNVRPST